MSIVARLFLLLLYLMPLCSLLPAEDVKLREEAVRLLERANQVSLPGAVPKYRQTITFRVYYPDGSTKEGTYTKIAAGAEGYREERTFAGTLWEPADITRILHGAMRMQIEQQN